MVVRQPGKDPFEDEGDEELQCVVDGQVSGRQFVLLALKMLELPHVFELPSPRPQS